LRSTASLIEAASETLLDSPASEVRAWYTPWAVRLACSGARIAQDRRVAHRADHDVESEAIDAIDRQHEALAQRLKTVPSLEEVRREVARFPQPSDLWGFARPASMTTTRYTFIGTAPVLVFGVVPADASRSSAWLKWLAAAAVVGLSGAFWLLLSRGALHTWLRQWPWMLGVLIGLAWWLWATPSLAGWIVVAVSLWGAVRLPMRSGRVRSAAQEASEPC
jgi:hypothetical protein